MHRTGAEIRRRGNDGVLPACVMQRVSQSKRCADLDKEIPVLMGVSKAMIENVVSRIERKRRQSGEMR
jgi:hypothetical protein